MDISAVIKEAAAAAIPAPVEETQDTGNAEEASETPAEEEAPAEESSDVGDDDGADHASEADAVTLPDGYVAVPSVTDALAAEFTLKDAEGEVEVPNLMVEYKANGKVRQDRLDQVVKLAQWGVYNQEREERVKAAESAVAERDQLAQLIQEREAQIERLLTDSDFLYSVQEAYQNENSPERRAERAEQRVHDMRVSQQMDSIGQQGMQFMQREIEPAIDMIVAALPTVTPEEVANRIAMVMQAHAQQAPNGAMYVPASRYDAIRQYIVDDLAIWAQTQHDRRKAPAATSAGQQKAERELERARVEAQKAKRMVGQTTRPVGQAGKDFAKPRATKPSSVDDAVASALDSVLAGIGNG